MTEANVSNLSNMVPALPKVMSAKTFNRIYGGHETLGGVYKLHQKLAAECLATTLFVFGVICCSIYYEVNLHFQHWVVQLSEVL